MPFLELIYPVRPPPQLSREKPMQVLAIGLSRTGTESLKRALSILGYDHVYHGFDFLKKPEQVYPWVQLLERKLSGKPMPRAEDFDKIIGDCEAVSDLPCSALAAELIRAYPNAKVVLNQRNSIDSWHESYAATVDPLVTNWWYSLRCYFDADAYWACRLVCDVQKIHYEGDFLQQGRKGYKQHYKDMRALVAKERALEWTVEDGWEPLCAFLGKPVPDEEFPKGNDPASFESEKIRVTVERFARCDRNMRIVLGIIALVPAALLALLLYK